MPPPLSNWQPWRVAYVMPTANSRPIQADRSPAPEADLPPDPALFPTHQLRGHDELAPPSDVHAPNAKVQAAQRAARAGYGANVETQRRAARHAHALPAGCGRGAGVGCVCGRGHQGAAAPGAGRYREPKGAPEGRCRRDGTNTGLPTQGSPVAALPLPRPP
jgi:hypothetical protein